MGTYRYKTRVGRTRKFSRGPGIHNWRYKCNRKLKRKNEAIPLADDDIAGPAQSIPDSSPKKIQRTRLKIEEQIGIWWKEVLHYSLLEAGLQEKEAAITRGDYFEGIPSITVIVDGAKGHIHIHIMH